MAIVYFKKIKKEDGIENISNAAAELLEIIIKEEGIALEQKIPLKVHFGEKGNKTFIKPENYDGIISFLKKNSVSPTYIETNVLYAGERHRKDLHLNLAKNHGFTQIPIIIADGEQGEEYSEIKINMKNFSSCKIGKAFLDFKQVIVISHFKGHMMAGFGGAIKQLSMGHASRGGKLAMHMGIKPKIINRKCKKCKLCVKRCNEHAIVIKKNKSYIDHDKCVGCGACVAMCPHNAITIMSIKGIAKALGIGHNFKECLAEYAYAAQKGKKNIYLNFALDITRGCDCEPKKMKPIVEDIGIFASTDPVAIDIACFDMVKAKGKKFRGYSQLRYAEEIGLGTRDYEIREIIETHINKSKYIE